MSYYHRIQDSAVKHVWPLLLTRCTEPPQAGLALYIILNFALQARVSFYNYRYTQLSFDDRGLSSIPLLHQQHNNCNAIEYGNQTQFQEWTSAKYRTMVNSHVLLYRKSPRCRESELLHTTYSIAVLTRKLARQSSTSSASSPPTCPSTWHVDDSKVRAVLVLDLNLDFLGRVHAGLLQYRILLLNMGLVRDEKHDCFCQL